MSLIGKGFFIWKIQGCENGNGGAITSVARQTGLSHILIKVADGTYSYNVTSNGQDLALELARTLSAGGIQVWGWHYLYGDDPIGEANKAIQRLNQIALDGYVLDVEREYKSPGKGQAATTFMTRMRTAFPNLPIALCSYRFPSYHPQIPWKEFLERCDLNMPQVYWQNAHNPSDQLIRSVNEFKSLSPYRPILPVGSAFRSGAWAATPEDVVQFLQTAQSLNLSAANFWEWSNCRQYLPAVWDAIRDYSWPVTPAPPDIALQYIAALNSHDPEQVLGLYTPNAVHVNAVRTIQGSTALRVWYQTLFSQLLPNATFALSSYSGTGNTRHITWTAKSSIGNVLDGNDTLGLLNGKIAYHYSFFSLSTGQ